MKAFNDERVGARAFSCTTCLAPCSRADASYGRRKRFKIADYVRDAINQKRLIVGGERVNASQKPRPIWRLRVEATRCFG